MNPEMATLSVGLWFDMQAAPQAWPTAPLWAEQLHEAHNSGALYVLAHADTDYAQAGMAGEIWQGDLWDEASGMIALSMAMRQARQTATNLSQMVVLLPYRASPSYWIQWSLMHLHHMDARLDNLTGLLAHRGDETLAASDIEQSAGSRWLSLDRIVLYGAQEGRTHLVQHLRSMNPLWQLLSHGFDDAAHLHTRMDGYTARGPLAQPMFNSDDLLALNAHKLIYFGDTRSLSEAQVTELAESWCRKYGHLASKIWMVVHTGEQGKLMCLSSFNHMWVGQTVQVADGASAPMSRVWVLGDGISPQNLRQDWAASV